MWRDRGLDPAGVAGEPVTSLIRSRPGSGRAAAVLTALIVVRATMLSAQTAYTSANGAVTLVPRSTGFATIDFAEARLKLQGLFELEGVPLGLSGYAGAAARMGQVDMFSAFDFNPGFEAGALVFRRLGGDGAGHLVYGSVGYRSLQRKLATFAADSSTITLSEAWQSDLSGTAGLNVGVSSHLMLGIAGSIRREWSSPGVAQPVQVCVETRSGGIAIPLCESRYFVEPRDYWAGQVRSDVLWSVVRLGGARSQPHLALLGSTSLDLGQEAAARWNVGGGVAVVPLEYRGHVIAAALVELYDATDANGQAPEFGDRLVVRVVLGVPFGMVVD